MTKVNNDSMFPKGNFIGLHRTDEANALQRCHPRAFLLLCLIARRARYSKEPCKITGLRYGQAFIGDYKEAGLATVGEYRNAKNRLKELQLCIFKGTKTGANRGTTATLLPQGIFSIDKTGTTIGATNGNPSSNHQAAHEQPQTTKKPKNKETKKHFKGCEDSFSRSGVDSDNGMPRPTESEFVDYLIDEMPAINSEWTSNRVKSAAKLQFDTFTDNEWKDGNGNLVRNWKIKAKNVLSFKNPKSYGEKEIAKPPLRILRADML